MLTQEENQLVTSIGPGTAMGEVLRRYWVPALLSRELPDPDCPPVRVRLLGEKLVAFRDTSGRVGMLEEFCPHRGASLWLGRNEDDGLRCVFHGWKFDVSGQCTEQMNEPVSFAHKVQAVAYPIMEMGGVVWTYMGPREKTPPPPKFEWTQVPDSQRFVSKVWQECNWLQALEGGIDTSHAPILHRAFAGATRPGIPVSEPFVRGTAPLLEVDLTDYGYRYAGVRALGEDQLYVRGYHFVMPWTQLRPQQLERQRHGRRDFIPGHMWIPIDDHNTMVWNFGYNYSGQVLSDDERSERGTGNGPEYVDYNSEFRSYRHMRNSWLIDRDVQKQETFTGIEGINTQDRAVQESMGPIVNRSKEHLGPADKAVISARRLLLQAIKTVEDGGDPPGTGTSYYQIRAVEKIFPKEYSWREVLLPEMYPGKHEAAVAPAPVG